MKNQFSITKTIIGTPAKDLNLTQREKNLFIYLSHFFGLQDGEFIAFPSRKTLSELSGTKLADISKITDRLVELGYISKKTRYDNSVIYTFITLEVTIVEEEASTINVEAPESAPVETSPEVEAIVLEEPIVQPDASESVIEVVPKKKTNQDFRSWNASQEQVDYAAIAQEALYRRTTKRTTHSTVSSFANIPF